MKGCFDCKNLISYSDRLDKFSCAIMRWLDLENAGACMVAKTTDGVVLIRNCPYFEAGAMQKREEKPE